MQTTSAEIFRVMNEYIIKSNIDWSKCVGICTDGAAAMTGKHSGLVAGVKLVALQNVSLFTASFTGKC
jgi:zinc finger BED domain-containing protein 5/7/8/9